MSGGEGHTRASIWAIGLAPAPTRVDRAASVDFAALLAGDAINRRAIEALYRRAGVDTRGVAVPNRQGVPIIYAEGGPESAPTTARRLAQYTEHAAALAHSACARALAEAGVDAGSVTHLVTASCTGFEAPGFDQRVMRSLGLRATVRRTHIGFMGCHAAINAMSVAAAFAERDPRAVVLVCCAELCSLHYHYGAHPDRVVANALFSDGAAAAVVGLDPTRDVPTIEDVASAIFPGTGAMMSWAVGDHGFEMTLSNEVPDLLAQVVPAWIGAMLDRCAVTRREVGGWAVHPGGLRIISAVLDALTLPPDAGDDSRAVLREHGNMSSATVLFVLKRMWVRGVPRPWVAMAFGPGLAGEALMLA